jgi:peptidoglycan/xylan/chitin deacetylase (PgdA/CDA1 family)
VRADPLELPAYEQALELSLPPGGASITVQVAPLYKDAKWAVTQRWDDNRVDSLRVRDLLKRYHMHGTFYLNASDAWYFNEAGYRFEGDPKTDLAKALRQGGNSIGGHTLTHNFVPLLNRQEQFYEMLGVRIDREVNSQSPLNSFVFPFTVFRNNLEPDQVHRDIAAELRRAGYLHVSNQYFNLKLKEDTGILDSWLLPCDGEPGLDSAVKALLKSPRQEAREGNICFCMHAWPHAWGGPGLPKLDQALKHWKGRSPWWYANQNELAAYRYQQLHGSLGVQQGVLGPRVVVGRYEGWAIGDNIPLTLKVWGYDDLSPSAQYLGQPLKVQRSRDHGAWLIELPQAPGHGTPDVYDVQRNSNNRSEGLEEKSRAGLEGLASRLYFDGEALQFNFKAKEALQDMHLTWRVPLGWTVPAPLDLGAWPAGHSLTLSAQLGPSQQALAGQGRPYFAAQLDFMRQGQRIRLYSDCRGPAAERDPQFPKGGFLVMGPLPGDNKAFNVDAFAAKVLRRKHPVPCQTLFEDVQGCWEALPAARIDPLHPELIPAGAMAAPRPFYTWDPTLYYTHGHRLHYLLAGVVESPMAREAKVIFPHGVRRIYINGKRLRSRHVDLQAGPNLITMLYRPGVPDGDGQGSFSEKNYGPFFRLTDMEGVRLTDIQYHMPDWLDGVAPDKGAVHRPVETR